MISSLTLGTKRRRKQSPITSFFHLPAEPFNSGASSLDSVPRGVPHPHRLEGLIGLRFFMRPRSLAPAPRPALFSPAHGSQRFVGVKTTARGIIQTARLPSGRFDRVHRSGNESHRPRRGLWVIGGFWARARDGLPLASRRVTGSFTKPAYSSPARVLQGFDRAGRRRPERRDHGRRRGSDGGNGGGRRAW